MCFLHEQFRTERLIDWSMFLQLTLKSVQNMMGAIVGFSLPYNNGLIFLAAE